MSAIISFNQIDKSFKSRTGPVQALEKLSFTVEAGQIFGLAGINGAGKTTAIRTLLGLCRPDAGQVLIKGACPSTIDPAEIGFAPETPDLPEYLTVAEVVEYSCALLGYNLTEEKLHQVLADLELEEQAGRLCANLSKGNRQRVSLAAAIAHEPQLIVLDEPTSGLDPLGRKLVKKLLKQQKEAGKTLFFSTHVLADLREICDCIAIIDHGQMVFLGPSDEFCPAGDSASLEERFSQLIYPEKSAKS